MRELGRPLTFPQRIAELSTTGSRWTRATDTEWVYVGDYSDDGSGDFRTDPLSPPFDPGSNLNAAPDGKDGGRPPLSFAINPNGEVIMQGCVDISSLTLPAILFFLPSGYWPEYSQRFVWPTETAGTFISGVVRGSDGAVMVLG